jgi:hypothetical protein
VPGTKPGRRRVRIGRQRLGGRTAPAISGRGTAELEHLEQGGARGRRRRPGRRQEAVEEAPAEAARSAALDPIWLNSTQ